MSELVATPADVRTLPVPARLSGNGPVNATLERVRAFTRQPAVAKAMR